MAGNNWVRPNAWTTKWFADPIAIPLAKLLARVTGIRPTYITILSALLVPVSAFFFFKGTLEDLIIGAILYQVAFVLDCTDGKVARLTAQTSEFGARLDLVLDSMKNLVFSFPALLYSQYYRIDGIKGLLMGVMLVLLLKVFKIAHILLLRRTGGYERRQLNRFNKFLVDRGYLASLYTGADQQFLNFVVGPLFNIVRFALPLSVVLFFFFRILPEVKALFTNRKVYQRE